MADLPQLEHFAKQNAQQPLERNKMKTKDLSQILGKGKNVTLILENVRHI